MPQRKVDDTAWSWFYQPLIPDTSFDASTATLGEPRTFAGIEEASVEMRRESHSSSAKKTWQGHSGTSNRSRVRKNYRHPYGLLTVAKHFAAWEVSERKQAYSLHSKDAVPFPLGMPHNQWEDSFRWSRIPEEQH
eukprot:scaffold7744_cov90-Cylindrotheca_fusiformis.AAC.7